MRILSVGAAVPDTVVTNEAVEARLGLEPGWIERRTGIRQRPTAPPSEATSDLAVRAGQRALERSGIDSGSVGLLLLATSTPDHLLPPTAPLVAHRLGLTAAGAIDLAGACAGFLYALILASAVARDMRKTVVVIGANLLTRRLNEHDPATAALFADGAGAVVLTPADPSHLLGSYLGADGGLYDTIGISAGGTRQPFTARTFEEGSHLMTIRRGAALFKHAVQAMAFAGKEALKDAGVGASSIDFWIPHQANVRITRETGDLLGIPPERSISVVEQFGNSSAATIPIALAHAVDSGRVRKGHLLLLTAAGAGMVSGGAVLRW